MLPEYIVATTAERLKSAMEYRHTTAAEISKATGISRGSLSQYISGKFSPKQDRIYILAKHLRVSPMWLMGLDVPMEESIPIHNGVKLSHREKQPWIEADKATRADNEWYVNDVCEYAITSTSKTAQELRKHLIGAMKALNIEASADTTLVPKFNALSSANQQVVMTLVNSLLQQQGTVSQQQKAPSVDGEGDSETHKKPTAEAVSFS